MYALPVIIDTLSVINFIFKIRIASFDTPEYLIMVLFINELDCSIWELLQIKSSTPQSNCDVLLYEVC